MNTDADTDDPDLSTLSDRDLAIADALDNPHGLYSLGQQHATEDAVALIRHEAALAGGNPRLRKLADRIEKGEATTRGAKRRRKDT